MKFLEFAQVLEEIEAIRSLLQKTDIVANFFKKCSTEDLEIAATFLTGRVFPPWSEKEIGIANQLLIQALEKTSGLSTAEINELWREYGDLGIVAERILKNRLQRTLYSRDIDLKYFMHSIEKIASYEGKGSQERKLMHLSEILSNSKPEEAKYIVRIILNELRTGAGEGIVRDAIAKAFSIEKAEIERAHSLTNDYGYIARIAKEKGLKGIKGIKIELFKPIKVMLAQKAESIDDAIERVKNPEGFFVAQFKYDGVRMQIHKKGNKILIFTRRLENVTKQFPEVYKSSKELINSKECIIDSEAIAYSPIDKKTVPFQELSKRIKRKYDIDEMARKIPVKVKIFDLIYLNGEMMLDKRYEDRWEKLKEIIKPRENFSLADHIKSKSRKEAEKFYEKALKAGQEGLMFKNIDSPYTPGLRVGHMVKIKPVMETLDLVIIGAEWGEGKRAKWLSSYKLACLDENKNYQIIGKMATGLTEEQFEEMTQLLKNLIVKQKGREVILKPEVVVEVAYEEIQKSPHYDSGFALRFPRLVQIRSDLSFEEVDDLNKVLRLYQSQGKMSKAKEK